MATVVEPQRRATFKRVVFAVHSWLGLSFCLLLTIILLSGTLAVFRDEIDWLVFPQVRVTPGAGRAGFDAMLSAVHARYPDLGLIGQVPAQGAGPRTAVSMIGVSPREGVRRVWIEPYRGTVQGTTPFLTPGYLLGQFHAYLMIPTWGYAIVCSFTFFMLASLVTGLLTYRKFWRGLLRRPRLRNLRTTMGDLHRLGGVWSLWFLVIIILTSFWYFWIRVGEPLLHFPHAIHEESPPRLDEAAVDRLGPDAPKVRSLDELAATALRAYPDFKVAYVTLPEVHGGPVTFSGSTGEMFGPYLSKIYIEPYGGTILDRHLSRDGYSFAYLGAVADALHFGDFGGMISKTVWFIFGTISTAMSVTGVVIFWKRTARSQPHRQSTFRQRLWNLVMPWGGAMGLFKPVNWLVLVFSAVAVTMTVRFYSMATEERAARFSSQAVGPYSLGAIVIAGLGDNSDPIRPGANAMVLAQFCNDCWSRIKRIWVNVGAFRGQRRTTCGRSAGVCQGVAEASGTDY